MTHEQAAFVSQSDGQVHLAGPSLFLRPVVPDDATSASIWHPDPWPKPIEQWRAQIERELGDDHHDEADSQRMLICRRRDDRPLGSVLLDFDAERECTLWFTHDSNRTLDEWAVTESEVMTFTLPWLIETRNLMKAYSVHMGQHPLVAETAARLGMRLCYRLRELHQFRGRRYDRVGYELLDPRWIETLGMPRGIQEGSVERTMPSLTSSERTDSKELAPNVIIAGERLSLCPFEPENASQAARWLLQDTEHSFPEGPEILNPWVYGRHFAGLAQRTPPDWLRFAIVRNDDDLVIGVTGLEHYSILDGSAETEIMLFHPEFRNRGYGTEAKLLLLTYAFERLGLHMVYSWVSEFNVRSAAALGKQGYREAGYFAWATPYKGNYVGAWYFDLLASEWRNAQSGPRGNLS